MTAFCSETLRAIDTLCRSVDDGHTVSLTKHEGRPPAGTRQDYEGPPVSGVEHEWVDQDDGGGLSGDSFTGTVTFVLGQYHLIVEFAS